MEIQAPQYPLSREAFTRALTSGHGRALVHAERFAARKLGEELLADPEFWISDHELWKFDDMHGEGAGRALLARLAAGDAAIRHYLQELDDYGKQSVEREKSSSTRPVPTFDSVIQTILSSTELVRNLRRWGAKSSPAERARVAGLLKSGAEPMVLINTLWCLCGQRLEEFDPALLEFAFHKNDDVRFHAGRLFSNHDEPQVRQAGIALLQHGDPVIGLKLLQKNARNEDAEVIVAALAKHDFEEDPHGLLSDVITLLDSCESIEDPRLAMFVYEFTPCMFCRSDAVGFLMKWGKCPDWVLEEAVKDGSEDVRKLVIHSA